MKKRKYRPPLKEPFLLLAPDQTGLRHTLGLHQDPTQVTLLPERTGLRVTLTFGCDPDLVINPLRVTLWCEGKCLATLAVQKQLRAMEGKDQVSRNDRRDLTRFIILNHEAIWDCWSMGYNDAEKLRSEVKKLPLGPRFS